MKRGDIVCFYGKGLLFRVLSGLLCIFDGYWRSLPRKFWHTAILWREDYGGWFIMEAVASGVKINYFSNNELKERAKVYHWLDARPTHQKMARFLKEHINKRYDVAIYFWTATSIILRHFWNRRIPKLLDDRYDCWELAEAFASFFNKSMMPHEYDTIIISDMVKALERKGEVNAQR